MLMVLLRWSPSAWDAEGRGCAAAGAGAVAGAYLGAEPLPGARVVELRTGAGGSRAVGAAPSAFMDAPTLGAGAGERHR